VQNKDAPCCASIKKEMPTKRLPTSLETVQDTGYCNSADMINASYADA
jgi:hypothetical protein